MEKNWFHKTGVQHLSLIMRKSVCIVFDQVRLKLACLSTQEIQHRTVLVVNFFVFLKLFFSHFVVSLPEPKTHW